MANQDQYYAFGAPQNTKKYAFGVTNTIGSGAPYMYKPSPTPIILQKNRNDMNAQISVSLPPIALSRVSVGKNVKHQDYAFGAPQATKKYAFGMTNTLGFGVPFVYNPSTAIIPAVKTTKAIQSHNPNLPSTASQPSGCDGGNFEHHDQTSDNHWKTPEAQELQRIKPKANENVRHAEEFSHPDERPSKRQKLPESPEVTMNKSTVHASIRKGSKLRRHMEAQMSIPKARLNASISPKEHSKQTDEASNEKPKVNPPEAPAKALDGPQIPAGYADKASHLKNVLAENQRNKEAEKLTRAHELAKTRIRAQVEEKQRETVFAEAYSAEMTSKLAKELIPEVKAMLRAELWEQIKEELREELEAELAAGFKLVPLDYDRQLKFQHTEELLEGLKRADDAKVSREKVRGRNGRREEQTRSGRSRSPGQDSASERYAPCAYRDRDYNAEQLPRGEDYRFERYKGEQEEEEDQGVWKSEEHEEGGWIESREWEEEGAEMGGSSPVGLGIQLYPDLSTRGYSEEDPIDLVDTESERDFDGERTLVGECGMVAREIGWKVSEDVKEEEEEL